MRVTVRVVSRWKHRESGKYHDPGEVLSLTAERAEHLARAGCVEILPNQKRKKPSENKARVPEENKGAE